MSEYMGPNYKDLFKHTLDALKGLGSSGTIREIDAKVIKKLKKNKDFESMINGVLGGQSGDSKKPGSSFNAEKILEQLNR